MVKLFAFAYNGLLFLVFRSVASFQVIPHQKASVSSTTSLRYTIIGAPDEEPEQDPHAVGYRQEQHSMTTKQNNVHNGGVQDLSNYRDFDEVLETEDTLNIDSFSHASGKAIMPGFHLTALCGDD
jgi:hypothetical protein